MPSRTRKPTPEKVPESESAKSGEIKAEDHSEDDFYVALSHEIRRTMIKMTGQNGKSSFTEFKQAINVSTGTLYHHLEVLGSLLYQKADKKYYLTHLGQHAYNILVHNVESIETNKEVEAPQLESKPSIAKNLLKVWPRIFFSITQKEIKVPAILLAVLLAIGGLLCAVFDVEATLIFFNWTPAVTPLPIEWKAWLFFRYIISMVAFWGITEGLSRLILRKKDNFVPFLLSFFIVLLPTVFYLVIHSFICLISTDEIAVATDRVVMVAFQLWALWYLTYAIATHKFVPLEKGFIVSFIGYYVGFVVLLVTIL